MNQQGRQNQSNSAEGSRGTKQRGGQQPRSRQAHARTSFRHQSRQQDADGNQQRGNRNGQYEASRDDDRSQRGAQPWNIAELAIRGSTALFDIQMATLRSLWQIQARGAAAIGVPDCSDLLRVADGSTKRLMSTTTEQMLSSARQASDTISEMQRQFGRIVEQGAMQLTEEMHQGIEELDQRTQEGLQEVRNIAEQSAQEGERLLQQYGDESFQDREEEDQVRPGRQSASQQGRTSRQQSGHGGDDSGSGEDESHGSNSGRRSRQSARQGSNSARVQHAKARAPQRSAAKKRAGGRPRANGARHR